MLGISIGRVVGNSMLPRLPPGAFFIAIKWPRFFQRPGQVYYLHHSRYGSIVKTLDSIADDTLWFRGESSQSVSRAAIGPVKPSQVIGRVVWVIKPR